MKYLISETIGKKTWWIRNWKWIIPISFLTICITFFFLMTGNATVRYGSVYLQPKLVNEAYQMASENETVTQKLGELSPYNFLRLIEGDVMYSNNNNTVDVTINLLGTKNKGKLDIVAHRNGEHWEYQKIVVRIKKPEKETIPILEK